MVSDIMEAMEKALARTVAEAEEDDMGYADGADGVDDDGGGG